VSAVFRKDMDLEHLEILVSVDTSGDVVRPGKPVIDFSA